MIEKRLVQWYAADAGVDLDVAEREIALTYVLRILTDKGLLALLAFKGGTAIRKIYSTGQGRFSLDLDFTAMPGSSGVGEVDPEAFILDVVSSLHDQTYYGLTFKIPAADYYATPDSCGAEVTYRHEWLETGRFGLQISFRAAPLLPVKPMPLRRERYFEWLGIEPPEVPTLDLHEVIGEKIRAAAQRSRVRDLYDLYQLASQRFNRDLVRRIAVVKCWETRYAFDPAAFLAGLPDAKYDWSDLQRLVRRSWSVAPDEIVRGVQQGYGFLSKLTPDEASVASDPYSRERQAYQRLTGSLSLSIR
jgi:predicted nucleotidyltransferase component of viral defense system